MPATGSMQHSLTGKSVAQQISVNTIYQGVISANNQTKTNDQIARDGIANLMGTSTTLGLEAILNKKGVNSITKQVTSNIVGVYVVSEVSKLENNQNQKEK